MIMLFIICTNDAETVYNAMRFANVAVEKGDEVNVFMLGKAVLFEQISDGQFNVHEQVEKFKGNVPYPETRNYIKRVMRFSAKFA